MNDSKLQKMFNGITNIGDDLIAEAQPAPARKVRSVWVKRCALAACVCLAVIGIFLAFRDTGKKEYMPGNLLMGGVVGDNAVIGQMINGAYYCLSGDELWRYTVGQEPELIFEDARKTYILGDQGAYYAAYFRSYDDILHIHSHLYSCLYYRPYDGADAKILYELETEDNLTLISFSLRDDDTIALTLKEIAEASYYWIEIGKVSSYLIDGYTGEILETFYENISEEEAAAIEIEPNRWETIELGGRVLHYTEMDGVKWDIIENGNSILPEGAYAWRISECGEGILIDYSDGANWWQLYIRPDGKEFNLGLEATRIGSMGENGRYVLYMHHDTKMAVYDTDTNKRWTLGTDSDIEIRDALIDGDYLYSVSHTDNRHSLWRINYDEEGNPSDLVLVSEDITKGNQS